MALQDLIGQAWPHPLSDRRATDDGRRRETSLWRVRRADRSAEGRRPSPPSHRASRAHMPRRVFIAVAIGWAAAVATLLAVVLAARWLG